MIQVTIAYPGGQTQDVLLLDVPRVGEHIRLSGSISQPLVVEQVLWTEGRGPLPEPGVIVSVRQRPNGMSG